MEVEIQSKTNNPLFNRTEVHFVIHHDGEGTPKRDLIIGELAGKLNVKKENIMINYMKSSFGTTTTKGYAKVYNSLKEAKANEKDHILVRNGILAKKKKSAKEERKPKPPEEKPKEEIQKSPEVTTEKPIIEKEELTEEKVEPLNKVKTEEGSEKRHDKEKPDEDQKE